MNSLAEALQRIQANMPSNVTPLDTAAEEKPICETCGGTGYIHYNVAINDPRFGKLFPCPEANCPVRYQHKQEQAQRVMEMRSSWKPDYAEMTFRAFEQLMGKDRWTGKRGAYAIARMFAASEFPFTQQEAAQWVWKGDWPKAVNGASNSVVLSGGVGIGKTGLAIAAGNDLMARGKIAIFIRLQDLIAHIQETYRRGWADEQMESTEARIQAFIKVPYLMMDEFEVENYSDNRLENIEKIIRGRMDRPQPLPTFITTNLSQDEFRERWGQRIADVVFKSHWVQMDGIKLRRTMPAVSEVW